MTEMEGIQHHGDASTTTTTNGLSSSNQSERVSIKVTKPIPYTFDLGNLTIFDANLTPSKPSNSELAAISRDSAQALINQILTTCLITHTTKDGTLIKLPAPTSALPREKPLPAAKTETKWEKFARKKGIVSGKNKEASAKSVYDEEKGEWVPKWGYKGRNKDGDSQWLVEVDDAKEKSLKEGESIRALGRKERVENVRRNERKQRANDRNARKNGA